MAIVFCSVIHQVLPNRVNDQSILCTDKSTNTSSKRSAKQ